MVCRIASAASGVNLLAVLNAIKARHFALPADRGESWLPIDQFFMGAVVSVVCLLPSLHLRHTGSSAFLWDL